MTEFAPFQYVPQFSEGSGQVGTGPQAGSGEGAGWSSGPFSYINGDTGTGMELLGFKDENGKEFNPAGSKRGFAVMERFLCIPGDGTLSSMSLALYSYASLDTFTSVEVANGLSVSVVQIDRSNRTVTQVNTDESILFGPEPFTRVRNDVRLLRPLGAIKVGVPMFLRVVSIAAIAESFMPITKTEAMISSDGNPAPANPFITVVSPAKYRLLYSIPISLTRVAR